MDEHAFSSSVIQRIVTAAARFSSFRDATDAVQMTGVHISENQVRRLAHEVGRELIAARDQKVVEHRRRQLEPRTAVVPEAVVVEIDGGRIRTRAADAGPGVHQAQNKEDKVACLATLSGPAFAADPCPEPPESFRCPRRVQRLVQLMKGSAGEAAAQENPDEPTPPVPLVGESEGSERWSPKRLVRTCVASLETSASFGPMMGAEAQERHFYEAPRRAFVADGSAYNWSIHRGYFGTFEPIVDFLHAVCYVFSSATAVSADETSGWSQYLVWMRACWQGRVGDVLTELDHWQERLGESPPGEAQTAEERRDPRRVVAQARSYLGNNRDRMAYPRYRREGLPTTSSLVESLVGEVNARVKSKQKHWNRPAGAESILQLRAAVLSQDDRMSRFFAERPGCPFRKRDTLCHESEDVPAQTAA
ncbi:LysR family transcriptional regulator [Frigoriglobus tundricola]|uniref:Uncharacterized protein n=1 Tax=Frigoriglobus tundricola TaxID=2774151 RepID=A0A6M5YZ58_9BACT|nr:LysR family transcriptional regulator [Frigoriglobus tundricola]QJW92779.1 hypothetical protein FTUN_0276 [Frigoriglobus tundricola]QJW93287.1 hypothetical protein FTUN_0793 [Frigoriglobus tundricola]QJW99245.1 hypothetical protein FTUN_6847 [Frigoriglobus tundricola]